jgi:hypothetical protein
MYVIHLLISLFELIAKRLYDGNLEELCVQASNITLQQKCVSCQPLWSQKVIVLGLQQQQPLIDIVFIVDGAHFISSTRNSYLYLQMGCLQ